MTEINPAGWLQNAGATHTAAQMRLYDGSLTAGFIGSSGRGSVHPGFGNQYAVTQNGTPNMSVNVGAGICYIPGTENPVQGVYFCANDNTVNLTIATAPGAGQSRIDLVVAKVQDAQYSGATNAFSLAVVTGTASASPSAPSAPNNSIILAQIAVGSSVSSIVTGNITDKRVFASSLGAPVKATSTTMPPTSSFQDGQLVYVTDTNRFQVLQGTSYNNMQEGTLLGGNIIVQVHSQTGIAGTETVIDNYTTGSVVLPPNRLIRVEIYLPSIIFVTAAPGTAIARIRETNASGAQLQERLFDNIGLSFGSTKGLLRAEFSSGAGATKIYCATMTRLAGSGTITLATNGSTSGSILVYDMGPISRVNVIS